MKPYLGASAEITVGEEKVVESDAKGLPYGVVFEDDGRTGYFYARDFQEAESMFVDAVHIYSVEGVVDATIPSSLRIVWSLDWKKAALLLNNRPHAMFDFEGKVGYSIDEFPAPDPKTGWRRMPWSKDLKRFFYSA